MTQENEAKEVELLPCPFCGGKGIIHKVTEFTDCYFVKCLNCDMGDRKVDREVVAIKRWNTRKSPSAGLALDEKSVRLCLVNGTQQNWKADYDLATQAICSKFAIPSVTENEIKRMIVHIEILVERMHACHEATGKHELIGEADMFLAQAKAILERLKGK